MAHPHPRPADPAAPPSQRWEGLFHLSVLYVVWSSTYLAIRLAVRPGAGFPPFIMSGMRVLAAGGILLAWAALRGRRLRLTRRELGVMVGAGLLLWVGGNGLVTWAEQRADSGYAALLVGSMPIWVAAMEALLDRTRPSRLLVGALVAGFAGLALLTVPVLAAGTPDDVWAVLALVAAPISWGAGSVLQQRNPIDAPARVSAGYQSLFGAVGFFVLVWLLDEPAPQPTAEAWAAWGYLVVFGSVLAFTSFVSALQLLPTNIVMTYAYVNPVGAAVLGWLILDEPITWWTVAGAALVLSGVAGVFRDRFG